jgi:hypothetical protein
MHIFLVILRKTDLDAFADLMGRKTGSRRRFGRQKSGRLVLVAWAEDIKIAIFLEDEMKLECLSGSNGNECRNLGSRLTLHDRFELKPETADINRTTG